MPQNDAAPPQLITAPPAFSEQPPNQAPYPPQQPMSQTSVPMTALALLDESPALVDCPFCHQRMMTRVEKTDSSMTILIGALLCLVCICAAVIPCIAHWCAHVDHFCSNCGKHLTHRPYEGPVQVLPGVEPSTFAAGPHLEANGGVVLPPKAEVYQ